MYFCIKLFMDCIKNNHWSVEIKNKLLYCHFKEHKKKSYWDIEKLDRQPIIKNKFIFFFNSEITYFPYSVNLKIIHLI